MATYVLVHGAGHGGWCFQQVARRLRILGHEVYTPTLTGLAERAHLLSPTVDLDSHVQDVTSLLYYEDLTDVVLLGHSYGGMVITGSADQSPDRVGRLVFLDAANPTNGQSVVDIAPEFTTWARQQGRVVSDVELVLFPTPEVLSVYGIDDHTDISWIRQRLTPHPWKCLAQPLRLSNETALWAIPQYHIVCSSTARLPPTPSLEQARAEARLWEVDAGHDVMLNQPDWLADTLSRITAL